MIAIDPTATYAIATYLNGEILTPSDADHAKSWEVEARRTDWDVEKRLTAWEARPK